ncbi:MAG: hypothetical protein QG610_347 [Euryarchaeota archaeon]|nr:hypothetical protein [Euryarchaeota archaeon]
MKNITITLLFIFVSLFLSGCVDSSANEAIMVEYNQHNDTLNRDLENLSSIEDQWNYAVEIMPAEDYYTDKEVNELSELARQYSNECDFVTAHNSNFESFIATNDAVLKDMDVDTYSLNKTITDSEVRMSVNCEFMVESVENATQHTKSAEQNAILDEVVGLLGKFTKAAT